MNQAIEALDMLRLLHTWWQTDTAAGYLVGLTETTQRFITVPNVADMEDQSKERIEEVAVAVARAAMRVPSLLLVVPEEMDVTATAATIAARFRPARPYWTKDDICKVVLHAAAKRHEVEPRPLLLEHAPYQHGFVYLQEPALGPDDQSFKAFSWSLTSHSAHGDRVSGFDVVFYSSTHDTREPVARILRQTPGALAGAPPMVVSHVEFVPFNQPLPNTFHLDYLLSWFHLIMRPLATRHIEEPPADVERRMEKANLGNKKVTVVTMRSRPTSRSAGPIRREFSHRWVVNGFWRDQYYPSLGTHKTIWIDDFVKGPEDKPLVIREKIYSWVR